MLCQIANVFLSGNAVSFTDCHLTISLQDASGIKTIRLVSTPPTFWITRMFAARRVRSILKKVNKSAEPKKAVHRVDATKPSP